MSKKKIKKALKMLGAGAAIAGLGKAFMNNRARAACSKVQMLTLGLEKCLLDLI